MAPPCGHFRTMANPALPAGGAPAPDQDLSTPPPMPSIAASALLESRRLLDRTRRALLAWLNRV